MARLYYVKSDEKYKKKKPMPRSKIYLRLLFLSVCLNLLAAAHLKGWIH